jgi:hypothetical protein
MNRRFVLRLKPPEGEAIKSRRLESDGRLHEAKARSEDQGFSSECGEPASGEARQKTGRAADMRAMGT